MPGRCRGVTALAVAATAALTPPAHAHRLEAEYRVLADKRIQVESWYDLAGNSPRGARVRVYRSDGGLLTEGELGDNGTFVFSFTDAAPLRVTISAQDGHSKQLVIPKQALEQAGGSTVSPEPFADRSPRLAVTDVLMGVAFVLAIAAFFLSLRTARRLRQLESHGGPHSGTGNTSSSGISH